MGKLNLIPGKHPTKKYPTIGVCGLDCGLCPRFYTEGPSRCPGCAGPNFFNKHPSCSFITCCVKNNNLEVCAECSEFPCVKFKSAEEYNRVKENSSYPSYKKILSNLFFIKDHGIKKFIEGQNKRIRLLEIMLDKFNDGRSRSFFCRAALFNDITVLTNALKKAEEIIKADIIKKTDMKSKANILRRIINEIPSGG
jgi:hypothetical protein